MVFKPIGALCVLMLSAAPAWAAAAPEPDKAAHPPEEDNKSKTNAPPPPLEDIVHGAFLQMRTGLGWMAVGAKIPHDPQFPRLGGQPEELGVGAMVDLAFGVEIVNAVALQLVAGVNMTNSQRVDRVRALDVAYGGVGVRLNFPLGERVNLVVAPNLVYARADNAVETPTMGLGVEASVGFEYYVHVRHFSLGVDLSGMVPLAPLRMFLAVAPHIRYTF